jgi:hypothetical protein
MWVSRIGSCLFERSQAIMCGGDLDHVFEIFGQNSSSPGITEQEYVHTFGDLLATDISRYGRGWSPVKCVSIHFCVSRIIFLK